MENRNLVYIHKGMSFILSFAQNRQFCYLQKTSMNLEDIMFGEISQTERDKQFMISLIRGIEKTPKS